MNIPFLNFILKRRNKDLAKLDSILVKKIKSLSFTSKLKVYKNVKIYHHLQIYSIPLLILDPERGIYIFEIKEWSYNDLRDVKIEKAQNQTSSQNTLAFDKTKDIIVKKFNELTHTDGVPIFNYLLLENLTQKEYEHLDDSFKNLIPECKVVFSDTLVDDISIKLKNDIKKNTSLPSLEKIFSTLFIQYAILDDKDKFHIATTEQIRFIDIQLKRLTILNGISASGKTSIILLKSIVELLEDSSKKIIIIKPTILACDILKKRLLDIVEHAIVEIDITSIEILTPIELLNKHREKLKLDLNNSMLIEKKLFKKKFEVADIIICDDADLNEDDFIYYLQHIQKRSSLVLVNSKLKNDDVTLKQSFRKACEIHFHKSSSQIKAMHILANLSKEKYKKILLIANKYTIENLQDDLKSYIDEPISRLDSSLHLIDQNFQNIIFCNYKENNSLTPNHVILMDLCSTSENEIKYAYNLSSKSVDILYEDDCIEVKRLKENYESNQE